MRALLLFVLLSAGPCRFSTAQKAVASICHAGQHNGSSTAANDFWEGIEGEENIVKLDEETFADFITERSWIFFYNTWCPVFKDQRKSIANIATELVNINYPGGVGTFECLGTRNDKPICNEYRKKCWKYNVYYFDGKYVEAYPYATDGYEQHAINFMKAHIEKPDQKVYPNAKC